jgi:hypothetical protein
MIPISCGEPSFYARNNNQYASCQGGTYGGGSISGGSISGGGTIVGENIPPCAPLDYKELGPRRARSKVREQIKDYVLLMLGAPVISIELDAQQLDLCVDAALQVIENYAPAEFFSYYVFATVPGKSIYKMPPDVGYIRHVSYKQAPNFMFSASDIGGAIPIEYFYPGGAYSSVQGGMIDPLTPIWGRAGEWVLYKQYEQMYSNIASNNGGWEFISDYQHIKLYPIPFRTTTVIVQYIQKQKDWNWVQQSMQEGALAYAKIIVGRIRSKIKNPPGNSSAGGLQLDGLEILAEGLKEKTEWETNLIVKWGDVLGPRMG